MSQAIFRHKHCNKDLKPEATNKYRITDGIFKTLP